MIYKKYKSEIGLVIALAIYVIFLQISGIHCPIRYLSGISCPGCGMSRACLSALRLDFASAFYYNPAWVALLPAGVGYFVLKIKGRRRLAVATLALFCAILVAVYITRLVIGDSPIVTVNLRDGAIYKLISRLSEFISKSIL